MSMLLRKVFFWGAIILLGLVVLAAFGKLDAIKMLFSGIGNIIEAIWLWVVGLFGFIIGLFRKLGGMFGGSKAEEEIVEENEKIRQDMEFIRQDIATTREFLTRERDLHQREMALLQSRLAEQRQGIDDTSQQISEVRNVSAAEFVDALPPDEWERIKNKFDSGRTSWEPDEQPDDQ